jgi:uncharacterized protein (DUF58 family)
LFTPKATAYFSMAVGLLTLALLLDDFQLGVLVLGLASLFFFCNIRGLPERVDLKLDRRIIPDQTFGNEEIRVESYIQNTTDANLANMEVHEILDGRLSPEKGTDRTNLSIAPRGESRVICEFQSPTRSNYQIGPLIVRVRDPFGFYLTETTLSPDNLCVMPRPERLRGVQLRPRHVGPWPGTIPSRALGMGSEFYSMRQYVAGDDPKHINWKASARNNELIVNENEAERVTDVMIVLESDVTFYGPSEGEMFERGIQAAASIASLLLRQGNRVGLVLQGSERGSVSPGFGKRHEQRILYLLAAARPGRARVSTSYIMSTLARRMLPSSAQIVIISSLLDPEMKDGVKQLIAAGYSLLILSPAPIAPATFQDRIEAIAFKMVMLERSINLLALERTSTIIDWSGGMPLSSVMAKLRLIRPVVAS